MKWFYIIGVEQRCLWLIKREKEDLRHQLECIWKIKSKKEKIHIEKLICQEFNGKYANEINQLQKSTFESSL